MAKPQQVNSAVDVSLNCSGFVRNNNSGTFDEGVFRDGILVVMKGGRIEIFNLPFLGLGSKNPIKMNIEKINQGIVVFKHNDVAPWEFFSGTINRINGEILISGNVPYPDLNIKFQNFAGKCRKSNPAF